MSTTRVHPISKELVFIVIIVVLLLASVYAVMRINNSGYAIASSVQSPQRISGVESAADQSLVNYTLSSSGVSKAASIQSVHALMSRWAGISTGENRVDLLDFSSCVNLGESLKIICIDIITNTSKEGHK